VRKLAGTGPADPYEAYANSNLGYALYGTAAAPKPSRFSSARKRSSRSATSRSKSGSASSTAPRLPAVRLLVTGAAGFIGSNFVRYWLEHRPDDHVVAYDLLTYAGNRESLPADVPFVHGDIADPELAEQTLRDEEIDVVVNFAAESHNSLAVVDPGRFFRTNVIGTQTLLEAARRAGLVRFHHVSTCEVYGDLPLDSDERFTEETPYAPRTPYNASKAGADHVVRAYFETYELPVTITNCSNNYGPYQFPEKVIPLFVSHALDDKSLPLYASTQNKREWLHVLDHCRAIELVVERGEPGETYNVGSGVEKSIEEIADAVLELTGKPASLKTIVPDRPGHDRRYLLDSTKIRERLGWDDEIGWEDGIAQTVRWYTEHREWWEPLRERAPVDEAAWR
jgi:dTDP-glucose 4,6-dehydratase